jgi:thiol-disulfide isomerase/thioredoxin
MYFHTFTVAYRCPPCKRIAPVFEKLAGEHKDIKFVKIDIDELADSAQHAGITSVPTFQFRNGAKKLFQVILNVYIVARNALHYVQFAGADESELRASIDILGKA